MTKRIYCHLYQGNSQGSAGTTEYASRWLKYADKKSSAIKAYLLSPFLYGHAHQSDKWLEWCSDGKLLKQSSNYNTQALSSVELVVVEALEIAANECLTMLEDDTNMKSKMEDVYNQSEKTLNFYQMLRIVEETEWLRLLVKKITPNVDGKDKEELQPNGLNTVAFCTVVHVYEYMFKRNDLPDFLDEFEEQCINDEKDSEQLKLKGNELFQAGKFAEAIACYSEAIVLYPFNAFLYSNRAACYLRTKDFGAALSDGYRAIVLLRDWYKGYSRYIEALAHINNKKATALCKELITSKFKDPTEMDQLQLALYKRKEKEAPPATTSAAKGNLWTQHDHTPLPEDIKDKVLQSIMVLLVSANVNETLATLNYLHPLDDHKAIFRFDQDGKQVVYYIGKYGACPAAVTNVPPEVDISTLANQCFPYLCATVSVGVAYGIKEKVQMFDVLVSSQIVNYDEVVDLDQIHSPKEKSPWLIKVFSQPKHWPNDTVKEHLPNKGMPMPKVMSGLILSGPPYHGDDPTVNNSFEKCGAKAIGIEMQRAYYFTKHTLNVIIVKAVCNFKDGKDNEVYQPTAALLAADLVHVCLSDRQAFKELEAKMSIRKMLQEGKNKDLTINVRHAKVLFCGAAKAGKTSFSRLLRNEEHVKNYKSTPAGNAQQILISSDKVNVVDTKWIGLDSKSETQQITKRLVAKLETQEDDESPTDCNISAKVKHSTAEKEELLNDVQSQQQTVNVNTDAPNSKSKHSIPEDKSVATTSNNQPTSYDDQKELPDYSEPRNIPVTAQEQMVMSFEPVSESKNIPKTWDLFTFLDTGGQPEFINMLPAINSATDVTFVVLNISDGKDCLNNGVVAQYQCDGYNYKQCILKYTNLHLLKCLFSSIKVAAVNKYNFNPDIVNRVSEDKHPEPVVYVIGTCIDVLKEKSGEGYKKEVHEIDKEVTKLVDKISEEGVLKFQCKGDNYVMPVDNTISRETQLECETVKTLQHIREECNTVLLKKAKYEIPISWFILELELRNNDKVCLPLHEVKTICHKVMPLSRKKWEMKEIQEILKFYHSFGMLLYFSEVDGMNNYVITDPQWLFFNLTKIIMCKYVKDASRIYDADDIKKMNNGICSLKLLETLDLNLQGIDLKSFLKLLVHLKVVTYMEDAYFMPTILPLCNDKTNFTECGKPVALKCDGKYIDSVKPLLIQFTSGMIPRGLFGFLVVQLLQDNADTYELFGKNVYNQDDVILRRCSDLICFFVNSCWYVSLCDKIFYLELQVWANEEDPSYHYKAWTTVAKSLETVCDKFNWEFSDCRYGFLCDEDTKDNHLTLLRTNPPYGDKIPKNAICCNQIKTVLSDAHTIWFEDVERTSKPFGNQTKGVPPTAGEIFNRKPEMHNLVTFVIPKIAAEWEDLAYVLHYEISTVESIESNHGKDVRKCCRALFKDWLTTSNGAEPKTWQTLLNALKLIEKLTSVTQEITDKLRQMD